MMSKKTVVIVSVAIVAAMLITTLTCAIAYI